MQKSDTGEGKERRQSRGPAEDEVTRRFTLHIFPMPEYVHATAISASPLHGPWPEPRPKTPMSAVLKQSLPANDASAEGFSDWEAGGQSADAAGIKRVEDLLFGHKSLDPSTRAMRERLRLKAEKSKMPAVVNGLLHLQQSRDTNASIIGQDKSRAAQPGT